MTQHSEVIVHTDLFYSKFARLKNMSLFGITSLPFRSSLICIRSKDKKGTFGPSAGTIYGVPCATSLLKLN